MQSTDIANALQTGLSAQGIDPQLIETMIGKWFPKADIEALGGQESDISIQLEDLQRQKQATDERLRKYREIDPTRMTPQQQTEFATLMDQSGKLSELMNQTRTKLGMIQEESGVMKQGASTLGLAKKPTGPAVAPPGQTLIKSSISGQELPFYKKQEFKGPLTAEENPPTYTNRGVTQPTRGLSPTDLGKTVSLAGQAAKLRARREGRPYTETDESGVTWQIEPGGKRTKLAEAKEIITWHNPQTGDTKNLPKGVSPGEGAWHQTDKISTKATEADKMEMQSVRKEVDALNKQKQDLAKQDVASPIIMDYFGRLGITEEDRLKSPGKFEEAAISEAKNKIDREIKKKTGQLRTIEDRGREALFKKRPTEQGLTAGLTPPGSQPIQTTMPIKPVEKIKPTETRQPITPPGYERDLQIIKRVPPDDKRFDAAMTEFIAKYPDKRGEVEAIRNQQFGGGPEMTSKSPTHRIQRPITEQKTREDYTIGEIAKAFVTNGIDEQKAREVAESISKENKKGLIVDVDSFKRALTEAGIVVNFTADQLNALYSEINKLFTGIGEGILNLKVPGTGYFRK